MGRHSLVGGNWGCRCKCLGSVGKLPPSSGIRQYGLLYPPTSPDRNFLRLPANIIPRPRPNLHRRWVSNAVQ